MGRMAHRIARTHMAAGDSTIVLFASVLTLWIVGALWAFMASGDWVLTGSDVPLEVGLLAAFGVAYATWITLRSLGLVGSGTGVGFRLVLYGFFLRGYSELLMAIGGFRVGETSAAYGHLGTAPSIMQFVRAASLFAYGYGFALVAVATVVELRRRRTSPAWTRPED